MDHDGDFYAWTRAQATALREAGKARVNVPAAIGWDDIATELEIMGASEQREIRSRLTVLLEHLLKLRHLALAEPRQGWRRTVREQRRQIRLILQQSPSLGSHPASVLDVAYRDARHDVGEDYGIALPDSCPFDLEREVLAEDWLPAEPD